MGNALGPASVVSYVRPSFEGDNNEKKRSRPKGRAPKGCIWSYEQGMFVADEEEAAVAGTSVEDAAAGLVVLQNKKPKVKRTPWHEQGDLMLQAIDEVSVVQRVVCVAIQN